jgi:hypothetical protein
MIDNIKTSDPQPLAKLREESDDGLVFLELQIHGMPLYALTTKLSDRRRKRPVGCNSRCQII